VNLMAGVVLPLESGISKFFDVQIGIRVSWLFGATTPRTGLSNF
jgi:hypothetical protein